MKNAVLEYTGAVVGLLGSVAFFSMLSFYFLEENGFLARLIIYVVQGGC